MSAGFGSDRDRHQNLRREPIPLPVCGRVTIGDPREAHVHGRDLDNLGWIGHNACCLSFLSALERLCCGSGVERTATGEGRDRRRHYSPTLARYAHPFRERRDVTEANTSTTARKCLTRPCQAPPGHINAKARSVNLMNVMSGRSRRRKVARAVLRVLIIPRSVRRIRRQARLGEKPNFRRSRTRQKAS